MQNMTLKVFMLPLRRKTSDDFAYSRKIVVQMRNQMVKFDLDKILIQLLTDLVADLAELRRLRPVSRFVHCTTPSDLVETRLEGVAEIWGRRRRRAERKELVWLGSLRVAAGAVKTLSARFPS